MMHPGSQWSGSQLAVTLQAVSGLVNCDLYSRTTNWHQLACRLPVALCWDFPYLVKSCD